MFAVSVRNATPLEPLPVKAVIDCWYGIENRYDITSDIIVEGTSYCLVIPVDNFDY